jgi:hypothetical protein
MLTWWLLFEGGLSVNESAKTVLLSFRLYKCSKEGALLSVKESRVHRDSRPDLVQQLQSHIQVHVAHVGPSSVSFRCR